MKMNFNLSGFNPYFNGLSILTVCSLSVLPKLITFQSLF